jgi:hypothetical protein
MSQTPRTDALMRSLHDQAMARKDGAPMQEPFEQMEELCRSLESSLSEVQRERDSARSMHDQAEKACALASAEIDRLRGLVAQQDAEALPVRACPHDGHECEGYRCNETCFFNRTLNTRAPR